MRTIERASAFKRDYKKVISTPHHRTVNFSDERERNQQIHTPAQCNASLGWAEDFKGSVLDPIGLKCTLCLGGHYVR